LNYSFDVLTSRIRNLGLYITGFTIFILLATSLPALVCCDHDTVYNTCSSTRIYRYTCTYLCPPLGIHHTTRWGVLTPLNLHVQIPEFGACGSFRLLIRDAQRKRGFSADRLEPHPSRSPYSSPEFSFCNLSIFCTIHNCISLCILAFVPIGNVIFL